MPLVMPVLAVAAAAEAATADTAADTYWGEGRDVLGRAMRAQ
jgi:hypothetical protein